MYGTIEQNHYLKSKEGKLLKKISDLWHRSILNYNGPTPLNKKQIRILKRLYSANFASAILRFENPKNQKLESILFYSCSAIPHQNKIEKYSMFLTNFDTTNLVYKINSVNDLDYLCVDSFKNINPDASYRDNDTEAIILENILNYSIRNNLNNFNIFLFTYLEPCRSCENVMKEFIHIVPNSNIYVFYQKPYNKFAT